MFCCYAGQHIVLQTDHTPLLGRKIARCSSDGKSVGSPNCRRNVPWLDWRLHRANAGKPRRNAGRMPHRVRLSESLACGRTFPGSRDSSVYPPRAWHRLCTSSSPSNAANAIPTTVAERRLTYQLVHRHAPRMHDVEDLAVCDACTRSRQQQLE